MKDVIEIDKQKSWRGERGIYENKSPNRQGSAGKSSKDYSKGCHDKYLQFNGIFPFY